MTMSLDLNAALNRMAREVASLFHTTGTPGARRESWELPTLLLILAGAALLRFWGLGSWGLENDEETMAMPTMHILKDGLPVLPSGMFYARGISQLYMMAASVKVFGPSEWALRLPSVLCGLAFICIVYLYGKRFLDPVWNMALAATAAFLPGYIADSQEARMYIFMLASLAAFGVLVFEWERTNRAGYLAAAVIVMLIGLQFHVLTVFGAFLVFLPGLLQGDRKKLLQGAVAFALITAGYFVISGWVSSFYPPHPSMHGVSIVLDEHGGGLSMFGLPSWVLAAGLVLGVLLALYVFRGIGARSVAAAAGGLVFAGICFQLVFFDYLGFLLLIAAGVLVRRQGVEPFRRMIPVALVALLLVAAQYLVLHANGIPGARKIFGAMIGIPSIWPVLRMSQYSLFAMLLVAIGLARALWKCATRRPIPDYWLFFVLTVWLPLSLLGLFSWDVEARYTEFALLPIFVCAFAPFQSLGAGRAAVAGGALLLAIAVVNPVSVARVVNAGYTIHPDHKGAAEFIRSLHLQPNDLLLAEDVNQQSYYLGHVDYWLIGPARADIFSEAVDGELRDIYTGTRILSSGEELMKLLRRTDRGAIYVIGSGEQQEDGRRDARGPELSAALQSPEFRAVYSGRDGLTKVWKVAAPGRAD